MNLLSLLFCLSTRPESVGTLWGSNVSKSSAYRGTQTFPVLGCIQNGAFNKWFVVFDTWISILGYRYVRIISSIVVFTLPPFY